LNLKLIFHQTSIARDKKTTKKVLKKCPLNSQTLDTPPSTGAILIRGKNNRKNINANKYSAKTFCCLVNLANL